MFKAYGITVDSRHLTLIASHITSGGEYRAFTRTGMKDSTSPLQQMSFETATEYIKTAALQGSIYFVITLKDLITVLFLLIRENGLFEESFSTSRCGFTRIGRHGII